MKKNPLKTSRKTLIAAGLVVAILIASVIVYANDQDPQSQNSATNDGAASTAQTASPTTSNTVTTSSQPGQYITLAEYTANPTQYSQTKKVYFFHASWCPICQAIEKQIQADTTRIPAGVTFIKTDFDSNTQLRKQYGVTYQYTFVQIDDTGNEVSQWTASTLDKAIAGIKS